MDAGLKPVLSSAAWAPCVLTLQGDGVHSVGDLVDVTPEDLNGLPNTSLQPSSTAPASGSFSMFAQIRWKLVPLQ